jgi:hypothetical protein
MELSQTYYWKVKGILKDYPGVEDELNKHENAYLLLGQPFDEKNKIHQRNMDALNGCISACIGKLGFKEKNKKKD